MMLFARIKDRASSSRKGKMIDLKVSSAFTKGRYKKISAKEDKVSARILVVKIMEQQ